MADNTEIPDRIVACHEEEHRLATAWPEHPDYPTAPWPFRHGYSPAQAQALAQAQAQTGQDSMMEAKWPLHLDDSPLADKARTGKLATFPQAPGPVRGAKNYARNSLAWARWRRPNTRSARERYGYEVQMPRILHSLPEDGEISASPDVRRSDWVQDVMSRMDQAAENEHKDGVARAQAQAQPQQEQQQQQQQEEEQQVQVQAQAQAQPQADSQADPQALRAEPVRLFGTLDQLPTRSTDISRSLKSLLSLDHFRSKDKQEKPSHPPTPPAPPPTPVTKRGKVNKARRERRKTEFRATLPELERCDGHFESEITRHDSAVDMGGNNNLDADVDDVAFTDASGEEEIEYESAHEEPKVAPKEKRKSLPFFPSRKHNSNSNEDNTGATTGVNEAESPETTGEFKESVGKRVVHAFKVQARTAKNFVRCFNKEKDEWGEL